MANSQTDQMKKDVQAKRRKGVHAKTGSSKLKSSKNYQKLNKGQGR